MSQIIQMLEKLGSGARPADHDAAIAMLGADAPVKRAFLANDVDAINAMLGGRTKMLCLIMTPEDQPQRQEDEPTDPDQDVPTDDK